MWTCPNCLTGNEGATCARCGARRPAGAAGAAPGGYHRMLTRPEIKEIAKERLSKQRSNAVLNWFLPAVIIGVAIMLIGTIGGGFSLLPMLGSAVTSGDGEELAYAALDAVSMLLGTSALITVLIALINFVAIPIITCGQHYNALRLYRGEKMQLADLFRGFKQNFLHVWGGSLWQSLFLFLWGLIPFVGPIFVIIKRYAYSMTPYILLERPGVDAKEALKLSIKMTTGHKSELFVLDLSFIGWEMLNSLTFGILGIFFVSPYAGIAHAGYYDELETAFCGGRVVDADRGGKPPVEVEPVKEDDETWTCPDCGRVNDKAFCANCGKKRGGGREVEPEPWYCKCCGQQNDARNSSCANCGKKRGETPVPEPDVGGASDGKLKIHMGKGNKPADVDPAFRPPEDL